MFQSRAIPKYQNDHALLLLMDVNLGLRRMDVPIIYFNFQWV